MADARPSLLARLRAFFSWKEEAPQGPRPVPEDILRFQPDRVLLERGLPPLGARYTLYALTVFVLVFICWACLAKLDKFVIAEGKLMTLERPLVLQAYSISIVKEIRVIMGQHVKKGDVLVVLDPTFAKADMSQLETRIHSLTAQRRRLECELSGDDFSAEVEAAPADAPEALRKEQRLQDGIYTERKAEYRSRMQTFEEQLQRLHISEESSRREMAHKKERLDIYSEFEKMQREIYAQGLSSRAAYLEALKDKHSVAEDYLKLESSLKGTAHEIASVQADREAYAVGWRNSTAQELVSVKRDLDAAQESFAKARRLGELSIVRAPMDAIVLDVAKRSVSSVIDEAEQVVTLVPADTVLEAEVDVNTADVGYLRVGQPALLKLATLPFQKHGKIDGVVKTISQDSFTRETAQGPVSTYKVRVTLPEHPLEGLTSVSPDFELKPGMSLTAEVNVGDRRVIEYFLYPILEGFDTGLREPR